MPKIAVKPPITNLNIRPGDSNEAQAVEFDHLLCKKKSRLMTLMLISAYTSPLW